MELGRIRHRFAVMSLAQAEIGMRRARALLDLLTARLGLPAVPDLGPSAVPDQLAVLVFDAYRAGLGDGVAAALADLRRAF